MCSTSYDLQGHCGHLMADSTRYHGNGAYSSLWICA
uniref:Uncharacterized protein n=1 Tax=Anguilla anguilla TaxID=7936 RepID=A0A0E9W6E4_ANGAN